MATALTCGGTGGCVLVGVRADPAPEPVRFGLHVASEKPRDGFVRTVDEVGLPLFVETEPLVTERDVLTATALEGTQRSFVKVEFTSGGTVALDYGTRALVGERLAVLIDGALVMSPRLRAPLDGGVLMLNGDFSVAEARHLAARLNAARAGG